LAVRPLLCFSGIRDGGNHRAAGNGNSVKQNEIRKKQGNALLFSCSVPAGEPVILRCRAFETVICFLTLQTGGSEKMQS
jgi:hypothetical protein